MSSENPAIAGGRNPKIAEAGGAHRQAMSEYKYFDDIPEEMRFEAALVAWLHGAGSLYDIPLGYRTELIFEAAVTLTQSALAYIRPGDTSRYEVLAFMAIQKHPRQIRFVAEDHLTEDFAIKACIQSIPVIRYIDWEGQHSAFVSQRLINEVGAASLIHASELVSAIGLMARDMLDDATLRAAIKESVADLIRLEDLEALPILEQMIHEGYWPPETDSSIQHHLSQGRDFRQAPATPGEALDRLSATREAPFKILHRQVMKTFPIEQVIPVLGRDQESLDVLFSLYSEKELRLHMNLSRQLRGRLLEQAIGL
jgi:hypothetical protein